MFKIFLLVLQLLNGSIFAFAGNKNICYNTKEVSPVCDKSN